MNTLTRKSFHHFYLNAKRLTVFFPCRELKENPPAVPQFDRLTRNILATNPRVTRFKIDWCDNPSEMQQHRHHSGHNSFPTVMMDTCMTTGGSPRNPFEEDNSIGSLTHERMES